MSHNKNSVTRLQARIERIAQLVDSVRDPYGRFLWRKHLKKLRAELAAGLRQLHALAEAEVRTSMKFLGILCCTTLLTASALAEDASPLPCPAQMEEALELSGVPALLRQVPLLLELQARNEFRDRSLPAESQERIAQAARAGLDVEAVIAEMKAQMQRQECDPKALSAVILALKAPLPQRVFSFEKQLQEPAAAERLRGCVLRLIDCKIQPWMGPEKEVTQRRESLLSMLQAQGLSNTVGDVYVNLVIGILEGVERPAEGKVLGVRIMGAQLATLVFMPIPAHVLDGATNQELEEYSAILRSPPLSDFLEQERSALLKALEPHAAKLRPAMKKAVEKELQASRRKKR